MSKVTDINGKSVQLREPYKAPAVPLVGVEKYLKKLHAASISCNGRQALNPFLIGEPGVGKTSIVYEFSKLLGKPLFIDQGREDLTEEDLICAARISDDMDKKIDYILSNLSTALIVGGIYFVDGICKMRPRSLAPYESVLDDRRYVDSSLLGERIHAHPGFRFIAATNPEDMEGNPLPRYMASRLRPVVHFGYPERRETETIVRMHYPVLSHNGARVFDSFWKLWKKSNGDKPPAPRESLQIFALAQNVADYETMKNKRPLVLEYNGTASTLRKRHVEEAFRLFFDACQESKTCTPNQ